MEVNGFYIIKESFFADINEPFLKGNKQENRPHYYCFKDHNTVLYWMIPLSSKVEKYQQIIEQKRIENKPCDILHIMMTDNGKKNVFLIADMFPITEAYIEREYMIAGKHLRVTSEHEIRTIKRKARKILSMLKRGIKFMPTQPDVLRIQKLLLENKKQCE